MRSKAPLALMEQLVMVLVFALAAALCVQVFVLSGQTSRWNESRDRALVEAQNAAEILKGLSGDYEAACAACGGQWNGTMWGISYDEQWEPAENASQAAYHLLVTPVDSETAQHCRLCLGRGAVGDAPGGLAGAGRRQWGGGRPWMSGGILFRRRWAAALCW